MGHFWEDFSFWFDWFTLLFAWCIVALLYTALLLLMAIGHCFTGQQLYLHWFHKALQVLILAGCVVTAALMGKMWSSEFHLLAISLQVTSPILQIVLVVVLTTLTWPFAGVWYRTDHSVVRTLMFLSYVAIMVFFYIIPLFMDVPCVAQRSDLPPKPLLMGLGGAEQIAPENTRISFETAANHSVYGFESSVRLSWDGTPFLMHDDRLDRTTNVAELYPNRTDRRPELFTWMELKELDAGSWFLKKDPFHTVASLSKETRERIAEQKVMRLSDLMILGIKYNRSVTFDLYETPENHPFRHNVTEVVVNTILSSGIHQNQIWWLSDKKREYVRQVAPGFVQAVKGRGHVPKELHEKGIVKVSAEYFEVDDKQILDYSQANITTNVYTINEVWLFSLYWCVGASSVTTSACHILQTVDTPIWHMTKTTYLIAWVLVDAVSLVCVGLIFLLQRVRNPNHSINPEAISLNSPRQKALHHHHHHHHHHRKSDREVLYQSNEDTPAVTPTGDHGTLGNMAIMMEDPVANVGPIIDHREIHMQLE
ncbi:glycerophosphodiester phosphodiesterase domain-containing protein 5-like [Diadema antillarum]|uniref:glycerophosphodiester phosphodiesterase domain-containing protein 5-like n=1 Tax=Diadema antillarum TaxID=105358 RepID=UPI003A84D1A5